MVIKNSVPITLPVPPKPEDTIRTIGINAGGVKKVPVSGSIPIESYKFSISQLNQLLIDGRVITAAGGDMLSLPPRPADITNDGYLYEYKAQNRVVRDFR